MVQVAAGCLTDMTQDVGYGAALRLVGCSGHSWPGLLECRADHARETHHGKPKLLEKATARRTAHRVMAKKKRKGSDKHKKDPGKEQKASRSPQGKQRQERRDGWTTRRRQVTPPPYVSPALFVTPPCVLACQSGNRAWLQVIKVPEGAVLRGCKKTRRKLREHLRLRAEIHSQLRVIASLFVLRIFLTCLVGYPTPAQMEALVRDKGAALPTCLANSWCDTTHSQSPQVV
ncbi:hypothetical protein HaLaN_01931 [Haematococcus lacustris]|uniref:Uncharacterized protein n=1 Tax=Haematococcus lacustris TaxID=44745 RepID=A0A699YAI9_HAELA|nr:hypothetical protein HaLaN_01931 [Haematococcus lacustris]